MPQTGTIREEMVAANSFPDEPIRCLHCHSASLILYGHVEQPYTAWMEDGTEVKTETVPEVACQIVDAVECPVCNVLFRLINGTQEEVDRAVGHVTSSHLGGVHEKFLC